MTEGFDFPRLCNGLGGLVAQSALFPAHPGDPAINVLSISLRVPTTKVRDERDGAGSVFHGAGTGLTKDDCLVPAFAEAIERYSSSVLSNEQLILASATELGKEALDLDQIPHCSKSEYLHPRCPLVLPAKDSPIRWVRAVSLSSGDRLYVPVVLVSPYKGFRTISERIALPITTGCAAHTNYERAILSGLLEVVERDALSILWLQKLSLPKIKLAAPIAGPLGSLWSRYERSLDSLEYTFFDATTDLQIPTAYCVRRSPESSAVNTIVSCSSALTIEDAIGKAMRDIAAGLVGFRRPRPYPSDIDDFAEIHHGATYMAAAERASAFDFLLSSDNIVPLDTIRPACAEPFDIRSSLRDLLQRLRSGGHEAYVVDLSTDEALRVGLKVVRVLVPSLQPMPYRQRARYLGHPRLYQAPVAMGHRALGESELNPWPNPFA